jgi:biopolymer transport protein ExbD
VRLGRFLSLAWVLVLASCRGATVDGAASTAGVRAEPSGPPEIVVAFTAEDAVLFDGQPVPLDALQAFVAKRTGRPRAERLRVEAGETLGWGAVVRSIDVMKTAGIVLPVVLAVKGERARRSQPISLPKAATSDKGVALLFPGPDGGTRLIEAGSGLHVSVAADGTTTLDGSPVTGGLGPAFARRGHLHQTAVILAADARAPFGTVVDDIVLAQSAGAAIAIGVAPAPP